ncbi:MAG: ABC transporter permease, partial [Verrucomicrobiales bacterium]|nr:ABC transporter permease [Verrucomicrobiales bacterium]
MSLRQAGKSSQAPSTVSLSMLFASLILRPLRRHAVRTVVTLLGVALGVAVLLGIRLANEASLAGFRSALQATSGRAALEIVSPPLGVDETLLRGWVDLRRWGVMTPVIEADVALRGGAGGEEVVRVLGIDPLRDPAVRDYPRAGGGAGSFTGMELLALVTRPDHVVVTADLAQAHGLEVGSELEVTIGDQPRRLTVAAVAGQAGADGRTGLRGALMILDLAAAQVLLEKPGRVDRVELVLHPDVEVAEAEAAL